MVAMQTTLSVKSHITGNLKIIIATKTMSFLVCCYLYTPFHAFIVPIDTSDPGYIVLSKTGVIRVLLLTAYAEIASTQVKFDSVDMIHDIFRASLQNFPVHISITGPIVRLDAKISIGPHCYSDANKMESILQVHLVFNSS